jgi:two-component system NtrC family sensor kinase
MPLHPLLTRQLSRLQIDPGKAPEPHQWPLLLERVSRVYEEADRDRYTLERSIEVSGGEMRQLYADLASKHQTLVENRQRIQAIFKHSAIGQAVIDEAGLCVEANTALTAMLGRPPDELVGHALIDLLDPTERARFFEPLSELLQGKRSELAAEQQWQTATGAGLWVLVTLSLVQSTGTQPHFASLFVQNVTERKQLEIELRHAQKLELVGRLAAGIAHEINTPVQFVADNLPFIAESAQTFLILIKRFRELLDLAIAAGSVRLADVEVAERDAEVEYLDEEVPRAIAQTLDGVERVATIVRAMQEFAHPDGRQQSKADLNRALASTITVARSEWKEVAEVQTEFGEIPEVLCNIGDLNQAFLNILVNAAHAIADAAGATHKLGLIRVRTLLRGGFVVITISDTGAGIPEHVQPRIFEPFFTTKGLGRGTGHGLALARAVVVERHSGQLSFQTQAGVGTTFEIRLPIEAAIAQPETQVTA